jgi:CheY-like chemotaxis protein
MTDQTILIIEDNPLNLELARDVLEAAGYTVVDARTAEEGLRIAEAIVPHLILLDIRLPGMNGLDAVRSLKNDSRTRDIPVVALTAQAMAGDEKTALGAGFDGYITKPINTRTLSGEVRRWLESPEAERERRKGA